MQLELFQICLIKAASKCRLIKVLIKFFFYINTREIPSLRKKALSSLVNILQAYISKCFQTLPKHTHLTYVPLCPH